MKTFYDGEEREILSIEHAYAYVDRTDVWIINYRRGASYGQLQVVATDELDAYNKFPAELKRLSFNPDDEESNKC